MALKTKTYDITLSIVPVLVVVIGIAVIYSLVFATNDSSLAFKQGISASIGIAIMFAVSFADYRFFRGTSWIFYLLSIVLLIYVDIFGMAAGGAMRWINLGFFQLQPSEFAKATVIISLASFFSSRIGKLLWWEIFASGFILLVPLLLILKEPDLGTGLVVGFIYLVMLFYAKPTRVQSFAITILLFIVLGSGILAVYNKPPFSKLLKDYQRNRILTFIDPNLDPYGKGYNVKQAQITVGSGGLYGKGLGHGSQSQLQFLPKPQTDFIFSGVAESFGFLGSTVILILFAFLVVKLINIAYVARDNFGLLLCIGIAALFIFQVLINVGMNLGLAPVTGIPLPFASYGGSALVAYFFLIGLAQSVFIRHKKITFE